MPGLGKIYIAYSIYPRWKIQGSTSLATGSTGAGRAVEFLTAREYRFQVWRASSERSVSARRVLDACRRLNQAGSDKHELRLSGAAAAVASQVRLEAVCALSKQMFEAREIIFGAPGAQTYFFRKLKH